MKKKKCLFEKKRGINGKGKNEDNDMWQLKKTKQIIHYLYFIYFFMFK
jgi:hypothetical protein